MPDPVTASLLSQSQAAAEHGVVGGLRFLTARQWTQLVGETSILQNAARFVVTLVIDENAARQDAERAFEHAHVLIEHLMRYRRP